MEKYQNREDLIAALADDMTPVRRIRPADGIWLIAFATLVAGLASIAIFEFWTGMISGEASAYFWITHGLLLMLGAASTTALVSSALPRVGARASAPAWSAAMLAVVPVAAIISLFSVGDVTHSAAYGHAHVGLQDPAAWYCTTASVVAGLLVGIASIMFLRRGAPVSIERAGWLTGLASGSLGTLAYGITCPLDTIAHVGLWHVAPVAISAVIGRLVVPPLIRW